MLLQLNFMQPSEFYKNFPEELRWLCMHGFPFDSIPSDMRMQNLVALDMSYSNFEALDMSKGNPQPSSERQKLFGSLKILNLSYCSQLRSLHGFCELPSLERLTLCCCKSLIEVCETVEQYCHELVLIDLSFCSKLKKFPSIGKLKKVTTLLLDGCLDLFNPPADMESVEVPNANDASTSSQDSNIVNVASRFPEAFFPSLPTSVVILSLENNKLVNESFPRDFSSMVNLRKLSLNGNLIVSMPDAVRTLSRLKILTLCNCETLITIDRPPRALEYLNIEGCFLLQKMSFDPKMSPLTVVQVGLMSGQLLWWPIKLEMQGMLKIQPIKDFKEEVLRTLGWTDLEFLKIQKMRSETLFEKQQTLPIQMFYEFGIFSTFFRGEKVPEWISRRINGSSLSFTMPSSPIRGLNLCFVYRILKYRYAFLECFPVIKISNITKKLTWIYHPNYRYMRIVDEECLIWLSHWMFGKNEMEDGDQVIITMEGIKLLGDVSTLDWEGGMSLVYDDGKTEEDLLGDYKSWNHIIGGDLSGFQFTTGEYFLDKDRFCAFPFEARKRGFNPGPVEYKKRHYKAEQLYFRALSKRKSDILDGVRAWKEASGGSTNRNVYEFGKSQEAENIIDHTFVSCSSQPNQISNEIKALLKVRMDALINKIKKEEKILASLESMPINNADPNPSTDLDETL